MKNIWKLSGNNGLTKKILFVIFGFICVGLGVIGIFLPLLPTTPFLLLAAFLFSKSSGRFYHWLLNHKIVGAYIRDYREKRGIALRIKIFSLSLLWITILSSVFFIVDRLWLQILLVLIASGVTIHILSFKTLR